MSSHDVQFKCFESPFIAQGLSPIKAVIKFHFIKYAENQTPSVNINRSDRLLVFRNCSFPGAVTTFTSYGFCRFERTFVRIVR